MQSLQLLLRDSGQQAELLRGLLTRAWWRQVTGDVAGAIEDLDEAWEIAERGSMKLHQTDVLLTRARLGLLPNGLQNEHGAYPWGSPREDLDRAARLIQDCGYHRRDEELADAHAALACQEQQQPVGPVRLQRLPPPAGATPAAPPVRPRRARSRSAR